MYEDYCYSLRIYFRSCISQTINAHEKKGGFIYNKEIFTTIKDKKFIYPCGLIKLKQIYSNITLRTLRSSTKFYLRKC